MYSVQTNQRSTETSVIDVTSGRQDDIHAQMYEMALSSMMSYAGITADDYRFVELKTSYFDEPSKVCVISKAYPYTRKVVDLTSYWPEYQFSEKMSYIMLDNDLTVDTAEVVYRDFVKGYAELRSRYTGRTFKVPLKNLPKDIKDVDDPANLEHSFSYKVVNKIYGVY